jgi:capsular exopolysaccharide synthesis family protein
MSLEKLTPSGEGKEDFLPVVPEVPDRSLGQDFSAQFDDDAQPRRPGHRSPVQKYLGAVLRRKWLLVLALVVGAAGAAGAYTVLGVEYTVQGSLWVQMEGRGDGDVGPIRQGELLESYAWLELLKSYSVLDPVVRSQKLYLSYPPEHADAFVDFDLADRFLPGTYALTVDELGETFALSTDAGTILQEGSLGDSIGVELGFMWRPAASLFEPGAEVGFRLVTPRDASQELMSSLNTRMDRLGNFISLSLSGPDPVRIANTLNAIMDRFVELAADLSRRKLDETLKILEEQYRGSGLALDQAERDLEDFRVRTITLPSDASTPIAGGLEMTRDPVFESYFNQKITLDQVRADLAALQRALASTSNGDGAVRVEALEAIGAVGSSAEMQQALGELVGLRGQLRTLRNDYTDDFPTIQTVLRQIATLEQETIPRMVTALIAQLRTHESDLQARIAAAEVDLAEIPTRSIEESRLRRQMAVQEALNNQLRGRVETGRLAAASAMADLQILDQAAVPQVPTSDDRLRFAGMILLGCLGGAIALAILLDMSDSKIRHADEVDTEIGLEILGSIPRVLTLAGKEAEENAAQVVEAFRELRVHVSFAYGAAGPVTLAVSSPSKGEGKTLITTNLAVAFSEMGRRTLLIDADTRRGDAHRLLGLARSPGLTDYLLDRSDSDIIQSTEYENLDFIGSGVRGPTTPELLASQRMVRFLGTLKRAYDVILVDCPPLAAGADPLVLAGLTGNMAVVLRTGSTDKRLAMARLEMLGRLPIRILGAILNDVEPKGEYYRYYGSYLPGYETASDQERRDEDGSTGSRLLSGAKGEVSRHPG